MNSERIERYADLIVRVGANVQPGVLFLIYRAGPGTAC
jgi:leucyl aminopeptidase (aminopeptidase T)